MATKIEEFNTANNKGYLWNLMNEHGIFDGVSNTYISTIKNDLDNQINLIKSRMNNNDNLISLNKKVITIMVQIINNYKENKVVNDMRIASKTPNTHEEIKLEKQTKFQNNLITKQYEFSSLILKPKPDTIDFSDKPNAEFDEPIGNEMEQKLAETIAWREKQLNMVLNIQDKKEANQWINKDNSNEQNNIIRDTIHSNKIKHLKIENDTFLEDKGIINLSSNNKKKVSFSSDSSHDHDNNNTNNFLSLLKKKTIIYNKETQTGDSIINDTENTENTENTNITDISYIKYEMNEIKQLLFQITENYNNLLLSLASKVTSYQDPILEK